MEEFQLPERIYSVHELMQGKARIPSKAGLVFCFSRSLPKSTTVATMVPVCGLGLLYIGSSKNISDRILCDYMHGTVARSTFRMTLGVLLSKESGFPLRRLKDKPGKYWLTKNGEAWLNGWIEDHLYVGWIIDKNAQEKKVNIIHHFSPPFNIEHSDNHIRDMVKHCRNEQRKRADEMPAI